MLSDIKNKIRALVGDIQDCNCEVFTYEGSNIFTLCADNVVSISSVSVNGVASGISYTYDDTCNKLTINETLNEGDVIEVVFCGTKYSDTELTSYVEASLVYISIYDDCSDEDFEIDSEEIFPTPTNKQEDLIALIASILIKPDYTQYKMGDFQVRFPGEMTKEQRIVEFIHRFRRGIGEIDVLEFEGDRYYGQEYL